MYLHLTAHSAFSLQEGLALPADLAQAAALDGMPALGLTDHRLLTGAVEFVMACRQVGVQPLPGLEIDLEGGKLALLATSQEGWSNLCRLSSALALREDPAAPCPFELLEAYSKDLIAIAGGQGDASGGQLEAFRVIFAGRLYLALSDPARGLPLSTLARRLSLPMVVVHPIYYIKPEQAALQRTLAAIRLNQPLEHLPVGAAARVGAHFIPRGEMERRFAAFPSALEATLEIARRCRFELPLGIPHMPGVPLPPGETAASHLRRKAEAGAHRIYGRISQQVQERLDHELDTIARMGFEPVFLIVEEILDFARSTGIPFSSRGSAASSLVAHCLGITSPDPLRLNLYFERFLNPARATPPDIDTDLCSRRREAVIQHVFETYGEGRAAMVGTINRYRPRSALGDVAKAHGLPPQSARELAGQLPHAFFARMQETDAGEGETQPSPFAELRARYTAPATRRIFDDAEAMLGLPRHLSVHPGGLVVAPEALTDLVPLMRSASVAFGAKGVTITQLDLGAVEALGLVKIDLLGIRGLTVLGDIAQFIQSSQPAVYASPLAVLEATPEDDPETSRRLESGGTIGCFQIESPGMRATLREIRARSEDDLMAALALYRPGPLSGGLKDAFVRRFKGEEPVSHIHPALAPLLDETFGVILYQEQVLRIAHELAGFSLTEADLLRRAMSHFDPGRQMQLLKEKFIREAEARSGIPTGTGERVWEMMAAFAGYGFPKAHAASYAKVAWRSAWCKTHFPGEFMAAVLANWGGYYSQRVYLGEARRMGLGVRPPHVNHSGRNFVLVEWEAGQKTLFMGLDQVRELTRHTIERIIERRPFHSLEDFLGRADPRPQEAGNLARVGALAGFGSIPAILRRLEGSWQAGQPSLFEWQPEHDPRVLREPSPLRSGRGSELGGSEGEDWSLEQKVAAQQELLGISLDAHPLELAATRIAAAGVVTTSEAAGRIGQRVTVAGIRQSGHRSRTAKGETMMFLTLEDLSGMLDVVLFPDAYHRARGFIHTAMPLLVTGVVERDASRGEPLLRAERVERVR